MTNIHIYTCMSKIIDDPQILIISIFIHTMALFNKKYFSKYYCLVLLKYFHTSNYLKIYIT